LPALRILAALALAALAGLAGFWVLTVPRGLPAAALAALPEGDAARGETVFWASGCASCHADPEAEGEDRLRLGGGLRLASPFGTFVAPNVSMHPADGIGAWTAGAFANAMLHGVSPDGRHYYPSFPYGSYTRMTQGEVADLWAFWQTLPAVEGRAGDHELAFPYTLRRGLGLWKLAFLSDAPVIAIDESDPLLVRGRHLVEGPGHCAECHTPRGLAGNLLTDRWLAGAQEPEGDGRVPNITGGAGGLGGWSAADIAYYLESGFTPEFDSVGGSMVAVQLNMAMLDASDRDAIAVYLKAIPPRDRE
jgi:mono/diheme cytochrome c family protein